MADSKSMKSVGPLWATLALLLALAPALPAAETGGGTPPMPRDRESKARILNEVVRALAAGKKVDPALFRQFVFAQTDGMTTGPAVGDKIPGFTLGDQNGKRWRLQELMGPKGLLLVFERSADW